MYLVADLDLYRCYLVDESMDISYFVNYPNTLVMPILNYTQLSDSQWVLLSIKLANIKKHI